MQQVCEWNFNELKDEKEGRGSNEKQAECGREKERARDMRLPHGNSPNG